jgi:hypothetical protein
MIAKVSTPFLGVKAFAIMETGSKQALRTLMSGSVAGSSIPRLRFTG